KESLMTIAERLRQEGEQSKALHIAKIMLESGVPLADIMRFTGVINGTVSFGVVAHAACFRRLQL
ncbi:hypothetical protein EWK57_19510, partial [Escherichia coli]